eukprot:TRINITY_DN15737_c0_g1_i2.p1 TRINITY_DN15737_c0_g1~~TRINITY_DN15737_c0_g1_i2.p1  ORF type:complete len:752 (-),score=205.36 TRINITY_DN15737_c0_g1_i2:621-2876(-)
MCIRDRCSWCLQKSTHQREHQGRAAVLWSCQSCHHLTSPCTKCPPGSSGFGRLNGASLLGCPEMERSLRMQECLCVVCQGLLPVWGTEATHGHMLAALADYCQRMLESTRQHMSIEQCALVHGEAGVLQQAQQLTPLSLQVLPSTTAKVLPVELEGSTESISFVLYVCVMNHNQPDGCHELFSWHPANSEHACVRVYSIWSDQTKCAVRVQVGLASHLIYPVPHGQWMQLALSIGSSSASIWVDAVLVGSLELLGWQLPVGWHTGSQAHLGPSSSAAIANLMVLRDELEGSALLAEQWAAMAVLHSKLHPVSPVVPLCSVRHNCVVHCCLDTCSSFCAMADAMQMASQSIMIAMWALSPSLLLRRDTGGNPAEWRLDKLLLRKASAGIKVSVLLSDSRDPGVRARQLHTQQHLNGASRRCDCTQCWQRCTQIFAYWCSQGRAPGATARTVLTECRSGLHSRVVVVDGTLAVVGAVDLSHGRWGCVGEHPLLDQHHCWPGPEYCQPLAPRPELEALPDVDRTRFSRMPWHEAALVVHGLAAWDVACSFSQSFNKQAAVSEVPCVQLPGIEQTLSPGLLDERAAITSQNASCQVLRSASSCNGGARLECSIYAAMAQAISQAEGFVYLEQQILVSNLAGGDISNCLMEVLMHRIERAIQEQTAFVAVVLLPVPVDACECTAAAMQWRYGSIARGGHSLLEQLAARHPVLDLSQYVCFSTLRAHTITAQGHTLTEQVHLQEHADAARCTAIPSC